MLDADVLAALAESYYQDEMESAFPSVVKGRTITQEAHEDGSTEYVVTDLMGPLEVDPEKIRPMLRAIARAIVEHLKGHAEVPVTEVSSGVDTKVGRIE